MTTLSIFREYEPHECGDDGYPHVWHRGVRWYLPDDLVGRASAIALHAPTSPNGVKDVVRAEAGDRCVRCLHPYRKGAFSMEGGDDLHAGRVKRETGVAREVTDVAFEGLIADGVVDGGGFEQGRRTHWSPCDEACRHGAPVRVARDHDIGDGGPWAYSWSSMDDQAETIDDNHNAGVLVRDGGPATVEAAWRILTVHHINGRKHDLRWWNLAALCQRCHLVVQRKVQFERVYPFEHTDRFKPYAAGWYAYAYLGENLTRAEVADRRDELLALERLA